MGLFNHKGNNGGLMDQIRCDESDYLIWKWRPNRGAGPDEQGRATAVRWGSTLRVKPGQAAVFLYQNKGEYDVMFGPFDDKIETKNFPVLASIVGLAYAGGTPFQAEIYFINLAKGMELPFTIPFFRVIPAEPEYRVYDIQVAIKGAITFEIPADANMVKYLLEAWGTKDTGLEEVNSKMKTLVTQEVKRVVTSAPKETGIFVMHFNSLIGEMGPYILKNLFDPIAHRFGICATSVLIEDIRYDEETTGYQNLKRITEEQAQMFNLENEKNALLSYEIQRQTMQTDADVRNQNVRRMAEIQMEHTQDIAARMREEGQFAQHKQSEQAAYQAELASQTAYMGAHALNRQAEVMKEGMSSLGNMGSMGEGGGGMNLAGMMVGMGLAGAVGTQGAQMMGNMGQSMQQAMAGAQMGGMTPPPVPGGQAPQPVAYFLALNGQQYGPCDIQAIATMLQAGQVNGQTLGWYNGLPSWQPISTIPSLAMLFQPQQPPAPPTPPAGAVPPPIPS